MAYDFLFLSIMSFSQLVSGYTYLIKQVCRCSLLLCLGLFFSLKCCDSPVKPLGLEFSLWEGFLNLLLLVLNKYNSFTSCRAVQIPYFILCQFGFYFLKEFTNFMYIFDFIDIEFIIFPYDLIEFIESAVLFPVKCHSYLWFLRILQCIRVT